MGRTACTEPQCVYKAALYPLIFTPILSVLHLMFLYNMAFCVPLFSDLFLLFVRVIFTESRVMKYDFSVISNGCICYNRINVRQLRHPDVVIIS